MLRTNQSQRGLIIGLPICCLGLAGLVEFVWPGFRPRLEGPAIVSAVSFWNESEICQRQQQAHGILGLEYSHCFGGLDTVCRGRFAGCEGPAAFDSVGAMIWLAQERCEE